jgi:hypothetical protein
MASNINAGEAGTFPDDLDETSDVPLAKGTSSLPRSWSGLHNRLDLQAPSRYDHSSVSQHCETTPTADRELKVKCNGIYEYLDRFSSLPN